MPPWLPTVISSFALAMASGLIVWVRSIEKENQRFREDAYSKFSTNEKVDRVVQKLDEALAILHRLQGRQESAGG